MLFTDVHTLAVEMCSPYGIEVSEIFKSPVPPHEQVIHMEIGFTYKESPDYPAAVVESILCYYVTHKSKQEVMRHIHGQIEELIYLATTIL